MKHKRGFTLIEMLVVISILAILTGVVFVLINPFELNKRGRDAQRLVDLSRLGQAITVAQAEAAVSGNDLFCNGNTPPCPGKSTENGALAADGGGWVKINLQNQKSIILANLPVDPINGACGDNLNCHYTYCSDGNSWEISAMLESQQMSDKAVSDGGSDEDLYEIGTNLNLIKQDGTGSCAY